MAKRKTLPKDFAQIVESGNPEQIKEVFEKCDVNAYENYSKVTALGSDLPAEVMEWLVQNGADVNFPDRYGNTPLHHHAGAYKNNMKTLIRLGADIEAKKYLQGNSSFRCCGSLFAGECQDTGRSRGEGQPQR